MLLNRKKSAYQKLLHKHRDISLCDRIFSKIFKYPPCSTYVCELYDQWLEEYLNTGVKVDHITDCKMTLVNEEGIKHTFWVYLYKGSSYGARTGLLYSHPHKHLTPNWVLTLRLRELQLSQRDKVLAAYREEFFKKGV